MPVISPLSSPLVEFVDRTETPLPPSQTKPRRLTHDLEEEGLLPSASATGSTLQKAWSFLDLYNDVFGIDHCDIPFDEEGDALPLSPILSQNCSSNDSFNSSAQTASNNSEDTHILQSNLMTPHHQETKDLEILGSTMELGNCTYELEQNNLLNSTVTKKNTTLTKSNLSHSVYVSSTPLHTKNVINNLTSDLITSESITPGFARKSLLDNGESLDSIAPIPLSFANNAPPLSKSPTRPYISHKNDCTLPLELAIKPADSTVDIDNEQVSDIRVTADSPLVKEQPICEKERKTSLTPRHKNPNILKIQKPSISAPKQLNPHKSTLPVMATRPPQKVGATPRLLQGMRLASSTSTLPRRNSLLPTSMKSKSYERLNNGVTSTTTFKHKK